MKTHGLILAGLLAAGKAWAVLPEITPIPDWNIDEDQFLTVDVEVVDPDSENFLFWADSDTNSVIVSFDEANMQVHISPLANWNGSAEIFIGVDDLDEARHSDVESFTVVVTPVNDCPVPFYPFADIQMNEDEAFFLSYDEMKSHILDPDIQMEGDSLYIEELEYSAGEWTQEEAGWTFEMAANESGTGQVSFRVTDGDCFVQCAFNLEVLPVNDCPVHELSYETLRGTEDEALLLPDFLLGWTDVEADDLDFSHISALMEGFTAEYLADSDELRLLPPADFNGSTQLRVFVSDNECAIPAMVDIYVNPVNDAPQMTEIESLSMFEDEEYRVPLSIVDVDGPELNILIASTSAEIYAEWDEESEELILHTSPDWNGEGFVIVSACDGYQSDPGCDALNIYVDVHAVNDAPVISDLEDLEMLEDGSLQVEFSFEDIDSPHLNVLAFADTDDVQVNLDLDAGLLQVQPAENWFGTTQITVQVDDGARMVTESHFQLLVHSENDLPHVVNTTDLPCGEVEDLNQFRETLENDGIQFFLADADADMLLISWFMDGELLEGHRVQMSADALLAWTMPAPPASVYDGLHTLHLEITDGTTTLNEDGADCMWTLDYLGVEEDSQPIAFELGAPWPNPFNPVSTIPFSIGQPGHVSLRIFNMMGQEVAVLKNATMNAGEHQLTWQAANQPSGVYLVVLEAEAQRAVSRISLLK